VEKAPLWKRGVRGDLKGKMVHHNKSLKECSSLLRVNMIEAEKLLYEKIRGKLRGYQF
jgi:hypothetical protein